MKTKDPRDIRPLSDIRREITHKLSGRRMSDSESNRKFGTGKKAIRFIFNEDAILEFRM